MKNFITILILSLAIIGCQTPNADPNGRTLIDPTDLIAVADSFNDALNSGDVEAASAMLADDVSWGFPNGVNIEGKDAVTQMLTVTTQIWTTIDQQSGETNYLGVTGGEQGEEWTALLSWGQATYANEANSVSVPYHQVTWFTEDNLIGAIYGLYDRTELVASYDEDPIK